MHRPNIYRLIHKWHHDSIETSSLTSFSFHAGESILQAVVIPVLILFLPLHIYALFFLLFIMTMSGTINRIREIGGFRRNCKTPDVTFPWAIWLGQQLAVGGTHTGRIPSNSSHRLRCAQSWALPMACAHGLRRVSRRCGAVNSR